MTSNSAKRRWSLKKKLFSDIECPEVTLNMVGSSSTPSKFKGKQPAIRLEESDAEWSPDLNMFWRGLPTHSDTHENNCPNRLQLVGLGGWGEWWAPRHHRIPVFKFQFRDSRLCLYGRNFRGGGQVIRRPGPESKENNLIWFNLSKNLSTPLRRCYHNWLRTKRNWKIKLLSRSLKANGNKGRARLLRIPRMKSIPTLSQPNPHLKRRITQKMRAVIPRGWVNWSNI